MNLVAFAVSWQHLSIIIVVAALGAAMIWYANAAPARVEAEADLPAPPVVSEGSVAVAALKSPTVPPARVPETVRITWPLKVDESAKDLDAATRLNLIERMGTIGGKWGSDILIAAFPQEREPEMRDAILSSLIACGERESQSVFEFALHNDRPAERAYAVDGLASIGAFESAARALDDQEEAVALAAAYALRRAGQGALVEKYLGANAGKPRAIALRNMFEVLS